MEFLIIALNGNSICGYHSSGWVAIPCCQVELRRQRNVLPPSSGLNIKTSKKQRDASSKYPTPQHQHSLHQTQTYETYHQVGD
jgi:hypothetical protein